MQYIYTMEYYSAIKRNTFESVLMRWMNLEPIIQSKVSQKEKEKYPHGDLTSLAPHERLPEILVVPREKTPTGAAARGNR